MKFQSPLLRLMPAAATCVLLAGCLLKPTTVPTRSFVLAPMPSPANTNAAAGHLPVGVGLVKMPSYLLRSSLALRLGTNEIHYLENALWAEQLDQSFQRAIAANLALLLPSDQIRLSAWQRADVTLAVYVNVEQFDVDAQGRGTLIAWWRVVSPESDKVLKSGRSRLARNGPTTGVQPETMVATLNELTAEFSQILARAIQEAAPVRAAAVARPPMSNAAANATASRMMLVGKKLIPGPEDDLTGRYLPFVAASCATANWMTTMP